MSDPARYQPHARTDSAKHALRHFRFRPSLSPTVAATKSVESREDARVRRERKEQGENWTEPPPTNS